MTTIINYDQYTTINDVDGSTIVESVVNQSIIKSDQSINIENLTIQGGVNNNEIPSGTINGINLNFTLAGTPQTGSLKLYLNGMRQKEIDDFTIGSNVITFISPPIAGDILLADYN